MKTVQFKEIIARDITEGRAFGKIKTRAGKDARIIHWCARGEYPIIALIDVGARELPHSFTTEGKYDTRPNVRSSFDLVIETEGGEDG